MSEDQSQPLEEPVWHQRGCAWRWRLNADNIGIYQCAWCGAIMVGGKREVRVVLEPSHDQQDA